MLNYQENKNEKIESLYRTAKNLYVTDQIEDAKKICHKILTIEKNAKTLELLGAIFLSGKNFKQSLRIINEALSIKPDMPTSYWIRARCLKELNKNEDAALSLGQAIALRKNKLWINQFYELSKTLSFDSDKGCK